MYDFHTSLSLCICDFLLYYDCCCDTQLWFLLTCDALRVGVDAQRMNPLMFQMNDLT